MIDAVNLPLGWAVLICFFLVTGATLTFIGSLGLLRLETFYQRLHAPTLGTTLGAGTIFLGSMVYFSVLGSRLVLHEILLAAFLTLTTPVTFVLLVRAARYRDSLAQRPDLEQSEQQ